MKKLTVVILAFVFAASGAVFAGETKVAPERKTGTTQPVQDVKSTNPLASETDLAKLEALIPTTDYKAITEDDYVAIMKNLVTIAKSMDISSADERKKAGLIYMIALIFQKNVKNPNAYIDRDGKTILDHDWFDAKAASVADGLKKSTKTQYDTKIDDKFTSDEKKLRDEFRAAKTPAK